MLLEALNKQVRIFLWQVCIFIGVISSIIIEFVIIVGNESLLGIFVVYIIFLIFIVISALTWFVLTIYLVVNAFTITNLLLTERNETSSLAVLAVAAIFFPIFWVFHIFVLISKRNEVQKHPSNTSSYKYGDTFSNAASNGLGLKKNTSSHLLKEESHSTQEKKLRQAFLDGLITSAELEKKLAELRENSTTSSTKKDTPE